MKAANCTVVFNIKDWKFKNISNSTDLIAVNILKYLFYIMVNLHNVG